MQACGKLIAQFYCLNLLFNPLLSHHIVQKTFHYWIIITLHNHYILYCIIIACQGVSCWSQMVIRDKFSPTNLYRNQTNVDNLTKSSFYDLFELPCLNHFLLSIKSFLNNYGAAKGYSLGPKLANAFMHHFGKHWVGKQSA